MKKSATFAIAKNGLYVAKQTLPAVYTLTDNVKEAMTFFDRSNARLKISKIKTISGLVEIEIY